MRERKTKKWKSKYIEWYRYLESVFENRVPHYNDSKIIGFVSDKDWIIVPVPGESDKEDARLSERPSISFNLSEEGDIGLGITYDKLETVRRLRNILSPFHERERSNLLEELKELDDDFLTIVYRKIKEHYMFESPEYERAFKVQSNKIDDEKLTSLFKAVDKIMEERELLGKRKYQLAPAIDIVYVKTIRDKDAFMEQLKKIKPIYDTIIEVKTEEEREKEIDAKHKQEEEKEKEEYRKFVDELNEKRRNKLITAEEYRRLNAEYRKKQNRT